MVHLSRVAGLDDEPAARALPTPDEVVMHRRRGEQTRDRRRRAVDPTIRQDDDIVALGDRRARAAPEVLERMFEASGARGDRVEHGQRDGSEAALGDVGQLGELLAGDHRVLQHDLPAGLRLGRQQITLRADGGLHRGHQLLADLIERGIRHLGEELLEVVVERPGTVREHGQRRVGAHRAHRLFAVLGHRQQQDSQVLVGVAERDLPGQHRRAVGRRHRVRRKLLEVDQVVPEPVGVGVLGGELGLDLLVVDDATLGGVDEKDPSGMQPLFDQNLLGGNVEHADLGGHDDHVVLGDVVARGAQAVPVEHGADDGAVGERDRGRSVPRLHQRGVVLVERPPLRAHRLVVLPRFRDHHEDRVRQRPAVHDEELEHVVEGRRVRQPVARDGQHFPEVVAERIRPAERLAGAHPVDVPAQRVDLPVVGNIPIRMRERPGRERVRAEALVHERERRLHVGIGEIRIHRLDLVGAEHPLVDERVRAEARHVGERVFRNVERHHGLFEELPDHVELALEVGVIPHSRSAADEHLGDVRLDRERAGADEVVVGRNVPPAEEALALFVHDRVQERANAVPLLRVSRQEHEPAAVLLGRRQENPQAIALTPQELVRHLEQDAGAIAGIRLAAARTPVKEVDENPERLAHDRVRPPALDVDHEADAAGVVLAARVVQPLGGRRTGNGGSVLNFGHGLHPFCENSCTIVAAFPLLVIPKKSDSKYQHGL